MHLQHITENQRKQWNLFAAEEPRFALLQSWEWGQCKQLLGWIPFRIAVVNNGKIVAGAQILLKRMMLGLLSVAYIPRGPIGLWTDPQIFRLLFAGIHRIARRYRAVFLKIEPPLLRDSEAGNLLRSEKFRPSEHRNQPRSSLQIDLTQDLDAILSRMRPKTRQYLKRASREQIVVRTGEHKDLPAFYRLMCVTGTRDSFSARTRAYYDAEWQTIIANGRGALLMAYHDDQLLAVRTVHRFGMHAAEFHAGSLLCQNLHPNHLLVWEAIKWARARGCHTYDLWGIPDELADERNPNNAPVRKKGDLWGVYQFKSGFSDSAVFYMGAYDYSYIPALSSVLNSGLLKKSLLGRIMVRMDPKSGIRNSKTKATVPDFIPNLKS